MQKMLRKTNKSLSDPILLLGAERQLVIINIFFWSWVEMGVFPHWPTLLVFAGFCAIQYLLCFAAKNDPQGVAIFRKNSRFFLQNQFYLARGFCGYFGKTQRIKTIPLSIIKKI